MRLCTRPTTAPSKRKRAFDFRPSKNGWPARSKRTYPQRAEMKGLLADINIQGFLPALQAAMQEQGLADIIAELNLALYFFRDFGLARDLDDRQLWNFCQ